jgi:hypothetical protein
MDPAGGIKQIFVSYRPTFLGYYKKRVFLGQKLLSYESDSVTFVMKRGNSKKLGLSIIPCIIRNYPQKGIFAPRLPPGLARFLLL